MGDTWKDLEISINKAIKAHRKKMRNIEARHALNQKHSVFKPKKERGGSRNLVKDLEEEDEY